MLEKSDVRCAIVCMDTNHFFFFLLVALSLASYMEMNDGKKEKKIRIKNFLYHRQSKHKFVSGEMNGASQQKYIDVQDFLVNFLVNFLGEI